MGILTGKDIFTYKFTTAIVTDSEDRGFFVPIKRMLDDYFLVLLNKNFYAFSMEGARIITHRYLMIRTFKFVQFDTTHYKSVQGDKLEELKLFFKKNELPRMNKLQFYMLKMLGKKEKINVRKKADEVKTRAAVAVKAGEKYEFTPHDMEALVDELVERQQEFPEESTNLINYIKSLDIEHIVTPVRRIAEYIEDDLIATKPSFLGELTPRLARLDNKHKELTNTPYSTKNAYMTKLFIIGFIVVGVAMVWWMIDEGYFDFLGSWIPQSGFNTSPFTPASVAKTNQCTDMALQQRYPEPLQLKIAIDQGTETCKLSKEMQSLVDGVELPKAEPKQ